MDFVKAWGSKIGHIVSQENSVGQENSKGIKTKCGRTIKNPQRNTEGEIDCPRCGTPDEYEGIRQEKRREQAAQQIKAIEVHESQKKSTQLRLQDHREMMVKFQAMLKGEGAEILNVKERAAGGSMEFEINGLKFKISGNIW